MLAQNDGRELCMPQKQRNLSFWLIRIEIDHIADSLLKLQIKIRVHLINGELSQLLTLNRTYIDIGDWVEV